MTLVVVDSDDHDSDAGEAAKRVSRSAVAELDDHDKVGGGRGEATRWHCLSHFFSLPPRPPISSPGSAGGTDALEPPGWGRGAGGYKETPNVTKPSS